VVTFFAVFFFSTGAMLILGAPVLMVGRRTGRTETAHRFLIAAGAIGLFNAALATGSERLVGQCRNAGNLGCVDYGSAGFQLLFVVGYIITSWVTAFIVSHD